MKKRPKIEKFYDCFPGKIGMGDIDGAVEVSWNFLQIEWKEYKKEPEGGQKIYAERRTYGGDTTIMYIIGNAETMEVSNYGLFWNGKWHGFFEADFDRVHAKISDWAKWAKQHPRFPGPRPKGKPP